MAPAHVACRVEIPKQLSRECRATAPALTIRASPSDSHGAGTYAARARVAPNLQTVRRMAAAKPMSALPTSIIAASSPGQRGDSGTDGTARVAVTVASAVRDSVDPIVGVAAASPTITNDKTLLRITSGLVLRPTDSPVRRPQERTSSVVPLKGHASLWIKRGQMRDVCQYR